MESNERMALLIRLIQELKEKGSWCGETHIQKASYFLQELTKTPMQLEFILYKHGPYSHELDEILTFMKIVDRLSVSYSQPFYGPNLSVTDRGKRFAEHHSQELGKYDSKIKFVANQIGQKGVVELEKLGTALFISQRHPDDKTDHERAEMIHDLKPHISQEEALSSLRTIYEIKQDSQNRF